MPPQIALILCILFILFFLRLDSKRVSDVSYALWIPLIWMIIISARPVSAWLYEWNPSLGTPFEKPDDILEGSPIDRFVYSVLIIAGLFILLRRKVVWSEIIKRNGWILLFFMYGGISILWADFQWVAFKRWIKAVGELVIVLVVLTETKPVEGLKTMVRRGGFILIPLSILLIKYYPSLGKIYAPWTGEVSYCGVAMSKNILGVLLFICGLFFFWNFLQRWNTRSTSHEKREMLVDVFYLGMIFWLLIKSDSATSLISFVLGCCILFAMGFPMFKRNPNNIKILLLIVVGFFLVSELSFNISHLFVSGLGREATLTGRTVLWKDLIDMDTDPLFGVGYENFWLGDRAKKLWEEYWWRPNEAHNGYLEIYLNIGLMGLFLITGIIVSSYRNIRRTLMSDFDYGRIRITILTMAMFYNIAEAGFRALSPMWFMFLLIAVHSPRYDEISGLKSMVASDCRKGISEEKNGGPES